MVLEEKEEGLSINSIFVLYYLTKSEGEEGSNPISCKSFSYAFKTSGGKGGRAIQYDGEQTVEPGADGLCGMDGMEGSRGRDGNRGNYGIDGFPGKEAPYGSVNFVVLSDNQEIVFSAGRCYDLKCEGFNISAIDNDDDVFEPGEQILVTDFTIINTGQLSAPEGAVALLESNPSVTFSEQFCRVKLPEIPPGGTLTLKEKFQAKLFDVTEFLQFSFYSQFFSQRFHLQSAKEPIREKLSSNRG